MVQLTEGCIKFSVSALFSLINAGFTYMNLNNKTQLYLLISVKVFDTIILLLWGKQSRPEH